MITVIWLMYQAPMSVPLVVIRPSSYSNAVSLNKLGSQGTDVLLHQLVHYNHSVGRMIEIAGT